VVLHSVDIMHAQMLSVGSTDAYIGLFYRQTRQYSPTDYSRQLPHQLSHGQHHFCRTAFWATEQSKFLHQFPTVTSRRVTTASLAYTYRSAPGWTIGRHKARSFLSFRAERSPATADWIHRHRRHPSSEQRGHRQQLRQNDLNTPSSAHHAAEWVAEDASVTSVRRR